MQLQSVSGFRATISKQIARYCEHAGRIKKQVEVERPEMKKLLAFKKQEEGATAIEYALIASIVGLGIVSGLQMLPPALNALFTSIGPFLNN